MLALALPTDLGRPLRVLCLGAHSDDIEIGAGGTILRLLGELPNVHVHWVVFSADARREAEARASAADFLADAVESEVIVHRHRESYFPYIGAEIKDDFEQLKSVEPDIIFTHRRDDEHQDHRTVGQLTWNTFRDHLVAEYEIPKYEGDLGHPNLFVPLEDGVVERKLELLVKHFGTQRNKRWFDRSTFLALMQIRGVECNAVQGRAEAFHARKMLL